MLAEGTPPIRLSLQAVPEGGCARNIESPGPRSHVVEAGFRVHQEVVVGDVPGVGAGHGELLAPGVSRTRRPSRRR